MAGTPLARDILSRRAESRCEPSAADSSGRLLAIVIGIDHYEDPAVPDLCCAVNDAESVADAIRHTQPADALVLNVLVAPSHDNETHRPVREQILEAIRATGAMATARDTLLLYYAGHGAILDGQPCLFPADVRVELEGGRAVLQDTLEVREVQRLLQACPCPHRVMFLDCCQNNFSPCAAAEKWSEPEHSAIHRALPWRTGLPFSNDLVNAFQQATPGWSLLFACGPNELSLEDPEWGGHGIFSHFLATGLRGEADLDGDGIVSLPELVQYLAARIPAQAEAVMDDLRQRSEPVQFRQSRQTPTMAWSGPIAFPLTRCVDERRAGWQSGIPRLWLHLLTHRLPYTLAVEGMARYGTALLYGLAMALTVWLYAFRARWASSFSWSVAIGAVSGLLWLGSFALAGAANETRWHSGGYFAAGLTAVWHAVVCLLLLGVSDSLQSPLALQLAAGLLLVLVIMIVFGHNALHCIISLADLIKRDLRVAGRRAFVQLDRQWIHADIDNMLAMVSAHPRLYQVLGLAVAVPIVIHAVYILNGSSPEEEALLHLARDFTFLVLVQWQVQWFAASYRQLRGILLPER